MRKIYRTHSTLDVTNTNDINFLSYVAEGGGLVSLVGFYLPAKLWKDNNLVTRNDEISTYLCFVVT